MKQGNETLKSSGQPSSMIPNPKEWKSNTPFGLLAQKQGNSYQRIGLVEIRNEIKKLTVGIVENVTISMNEHEENPKVKKKCYKFRARSCKN